MTARCIWIGAGVFMALAVFCTLGPDDSIAPEGQAAFRCAESAAGACACFAPGTSEEYITEFMRGLHGDGVPDGAEGFQTDQRWTNTVTDGAVGGTTPITLTYSFVPDYNTGNPFTSNSLFATLNAQFGSTSAWKSKFREIFDEWSAQSGITFVEVSDDQASWPDTSGGLNLRGDVRIVGFDVDGQYGVLAYAYTPNVGDMALDVNEYWGDSANDYRFLRNVVLHELGHALGLLHVLPRNGTKLMEALYNDSFDGPQDDDIRGLNSYYGDRFEDNDGSASATDLGALDPDGVTVDDLSLDASSDNDWYRLNAPTGTVVVVACTPVGASYQVGPDPGTPIQVNTRAINPLKVEVYDSSGTTLLGSKTAPSAGQSVTLDGVATSGGLFYVRILTAGSVNGVQRYSMSVSEGAALERTLTLNSLAVAGVPIGVSPAALGGQTSIATPGALLYSNGAEVTATAPTTFGAGTFVRWQIDDALQPIGAVSVFVTLDNSRTATAHYTTGIVVDAGTDQIVIRGVSAQLGVQTIGGTQPLTYEWSPTDSLSDAAIANPVATPSGTTTYTVIVRDSAGNFSTDTVQIQVLPPLTVNAGDDRAVLSGRAFTLSGTAGGGVAPHRFEWSPAAGLSNPASQNPQAVINAGTDFTLTVTDSAGTTASDTVRVDLAAPLGVSAGDDTSFNSGSPVVLTATIQGGVPPFTYAWSPSGAGGPLNAAVVEVRPTKTTTYTVAVTDSAGQQASDQIVLTLATPLRVAASASATEISPDEEVTLSASISGGGPPFTYRWSGGPGIAQSTSAQTTVQPTESTTYTLAVSDSVGQSGTADVRIEVRSNGGAGGGAATAAPLCAFGVAQGAFAALVGLATVRRARFRP